jgi:hypothetical protein
VIAKQNESGSQREIVWLGYAMFTDGSIYPHLAINGLALVVG